MEKLGLSVFGKNNEQKYFAIYLNDSTYKENVSGDTAKEIALKVIK